jgi:hypothetical protein
MTTNKKLTKRDHFNALLNIPAVANDEALTAFVKHELELLDRKNSGDKKPTATQIANDGIKTAIVEGMEQGRLYTVTEIIKEIDGCAELTNQKVSALLRPLVENGTIVKTIDKRKSYFSLAE